MNHEDVIDVMGNFLDHVKVVSYQLKNSVQKLGLVSEHAYLHVLGDDQQTYHFFVKLCPNVPLMRDYVMDNHVYDREMFFNETLFRHTYQKYQIKINECIPNYYHAKQNCFIVFEDLTTQGFVSLDKRTLLDYPTVATVLQTLAQFHACSLIYEERRSKELHQPYRINQDEHIVRNLNENFYIAREDSIMRQGIEVAIREILKLIDYFHLDEIIVAGRSFTQMADECCHRVFALTRPSQQFRNVIVHRDLWATNVMVRYEKEKPVAARLIDFQVGGYNPPSQDVLAFIHLTTSRDFRTRHLDHLLYFYYQTLASSLAVEGLNVKTMITWEEFLDSCHAQRHFAVIQAAHYFQLILLEDGVLRELFNDEGRLHAIMYENRDDLIRPNLARDEFYRERLREAILDLKDLCR